MSSWRHCSGCSKKRLSDGGCEISLVKWLCATCWAKYIQRKFKK